MRRARDNGLLLTDAGVLIGINLGADYCSEHEWGIKGLREMFGMKDEGYGLDKRTVTKMPEGTEWNNDVARPWVKLIKKRNKTTLLVGRYCTQEGYDLKHLELGDYNKEKLSTAWDEKSFGIEAYSKGDQLAVNEIYKAMESGDLAIWLSGGGVFQNAGLVLAIVSRIPTDKAEQLREADLDRERLEKAALKTGIAKKLEHAGKRYFALSPKWKKDIHNADSKYDVVFWLNPYDQENNNFGYFVVEDLEEWAEGRGCIPKTEEQRRKRG